MKYIKVDKIPEVVRKRKNKLQEFIKEFMADEKINKAKVEIKPGEYKRPWTAYQCLWNAVKISGENCKCIYRKGEIFLIKTI